VKTYTTQGKGLGSVKIYIDSCCYGRPHDDQTQERIADETTAITTIIELCKMVGIPIVGSLAVTTEIAQNKNATKRGSVQAYYESTVSEEIEFNADIIKQGTEYANNANLDGLDGYHLAAALAAGADVLLSTDDYFVSSVQNRLTVQIKVLNPRTYLGGLI